MGDDATTTAQSSSPNEHSQYKTLVQRFFHKTKSLSVVTKEIVEDLEFIRSRTAAVIEQSPNYEDFDVLTALLSIISELAMSIDWSSLDKPYYWDDFCYASKELIEKVPRLKKNASSLCAKSKKLCKQSENLFPYIDTVAKDDHRPHDEIMKTIIQTRHTPPVGIHILWNNFKKEIETKSQNPDGTYREETLKVSTDRVRIRILRYLMNYTKVVIDSNSVTLKKLDSILDSQIAMDSLQKCNVSKESNLTPYEHRLVVEGKSVLDEALVEIYDAVSMLTYHFKCHKPFVDVLRKIKPNKRIDHAKAFLRLDLCVDDNRLISFWYREVMHMEGNEDDEDQFPVMLQDRSDDTLDIIGDMMNFSSGCFKKMEAIIFLLKKCKWNVFDESTPTNKNNPKVRIALSGIKSNLKPLKQFLSKCIKCLKNDNLLQHFVPDSLQMAEFIRFRDINPDGLWNIKTFEGIHAPLWIPLTDDHQISFIEDAVTLKNLQDETMSFEELPLPEKVTVVMKLLGNLNNIICYGRYFIEYGYERVKHATVLAKRLTKTDQTGKALANSVKNGANELNLLLELTKEIEMLQELIV